MSNPTQAYMLGRGIGTSYALQTLALKPKPMDFSNVPAPQIVNGVIQTDLPHQSGNYPTGSYFDPAD
jgi:hypothetical protein